MIKCRLLVLWVIIISLCSCGRNKKKYIHDARLLSFKNQGVYSQDDLIEMDSNVRKVIMSDTFSKKTDTIKYDKGLIYISYLKATDASSKIEGNIEFNKDTIKLITASDLVATEQNVDRMIYLIENKNNKHYFLKKY